MRTRLLAIAAALIFQSFGAAIQSQTLDLEVHQACLAAPNIGCLLDLAQVERDEFWRASPNDAAFDQDNWLEHAVRVEVPAGELDRASTHLAQMGPSKLRYLFVTEDDEDPYLSADFDAEGKIHDALEAQLTDPKYRDKLASADLGRRANIAWVLSALGYKDRGTAVLDRTIQEFIVALEANDTEVVFAAGDLLDAAIAMRADEAAGRLVQAISLPEMSEQGYSKEWPGWTNEIDLLSYERAKTERQLVEAPSSARISPEDPAYDRFQAVLAWALAGDIDKVIFYIRGLPPGNDGNSRFVQIIVLVGDLLEHERPDLALIVAEEEVSDWDRSNHILSIAVYHRERGQISQAEVLLDRLTDPGARAALLIWLAQDKALKGEDELARDLLDRGGEALSNEPDLARQAFLNFDIASVHAELGDFAAARVAVDNGLQISQSIQDPMSQFYAAINAATVLATIGDGMEALAPFKRLGDSVSPSDLAFGAIETAKALANQGRGELAADLVGEVLRSMYRMPEIYHDDWSYLYVTAAEALIVPP